MERNKQEFSISSQESIENKRQKKQIMGKKNALNLPYPQTMVKSQYIKGVFHDINLIPSFDVL